MLNAQSHGDSSLLKVMLTLTATVFLWLLLNYLFEEEGHSVLYSNGPNSAILTTSIVLILVCNSYLCTKCKFNIPNTSQVRIFLINQISKKLE